MIFLIIAILCGFLSILVKSTTIDFSTSNDGKYTVEFVEVESTTFFGPQKIEITFKNKNEFVDKKETTLLTMEKCLIMIIGLFTGKISM